MGEYDDFLVRAMGTLIVLIYFVALFACAAASYQNYQREAILMDGLRNAIECPEEEP